MSKIAKCQKCGKEIKELAKAVSNWMKNEKGYLCGLCQGLTDYPWKIYTFSAPKKRDEELNKKEVRST